MGWVKANVNGGGVAWVTVKVETAVPVVVVNQTASLGVTVWAEAGSVVEAATTAKPRTSDLHLL